MQSVASSREITAMSVAIKDSSETLDCVALAYVILILRYNVIVWLVLHGFDLKIIFNLHRYIGNFFFF